MPVAPVIEVRGASPYRVEITVVNAEAVEADCTEHLFVVKYRTLPHVASLFPAQR